MYDLTSFPTSHKTSFLQESEYQIYVLNYLNSYGYKYKYKCTSKNS